MDIKKRDLIKLFQKNGWSLYRQGSNHEVWKKENKSETIPRHSEVNEILAKAIIRRNNLK